LNSIAIGIIGSTPPSFSDSCAAHQVASLLEI